MKNLVSRFGVVLIAMLWAGGLQAQGGTGRLTGVVRDARGAPLPGVTVVVTDQGGASQSLTTSANGSYTASNLAPGTYTVEAELEGFQKVSRTGVAVGGGATATADLALEQLKLKEEITVTGTRFEGRVITETPAPVDYIDAEAIRSTGATETGKILQLLEPSFNFSTTTISDGTDIIRPATLRSLGPDQVLVLINGKRRHQQALLNVQQTIGRGSAGYDLDSIPASAIDHIEVLRDGAAAQYGSDAIAGVINIILKKQTGSTEVSLEGGATYEGDGKGFATGVDTGFAVGGKGFVNISAEYRDRGETNRAGPDSLRVSPPRVTQRIGDPIAKDAALWLNSALPAGDGELYAFGGYSNRRGNSSGFFRSKGDGRTIPALYPNGFLPTIVTEPTDASLNAGYRGKLRGDWNYDLGASYGTSRFQFHEQNSANVTYWFDPIDSNNPNGPKFQQTPTSADTGRLELGQTNVGLDVTGKVNWGIGGGPLLVATGAEWRKDTYRIKAGDPVSYQYGRRDDRSIPIFDQTGAIAQPGTQGFPGWSPREAVNGNRDNTAAYVDLESNLTSSFLGGAAARFEHYSDFGSTLTGKLSGRYDFTKQFSLRATLSNGFRAPGVQQAFYSQRSTNLNAAGVLTDTLTARQDSAVTRAFGIPALKEEKSTNYSLGLVAKPSDDFRLTVDLYRIDIKNRIVFSSNIQPEDLATCGTPFDPRRCPIQAILAPIGVGQVLFFTNAIDTKTQGLDVVAVYNWRLSSESLMTLEGAFDFNKTEVTRRRSSSSILPPNVLFDDSQKTLVEQGQPRQHFVIGPTYYYGPWTGVLRLNYFGSVAGSGFTPGFTQTWGGKWLTDLSFTYALRNGLSVTAGGLNIFNVYPDKWDPVRAFPFPQLGFVYGWETLPFGINGGYYFARLNYKFSH
jgi:iron complex outermembrane receptor protein